MTLTEILLITILLLIIIAIVISFFNRSENKNDDLKTELVRLNADISKIDPLIRTEFSGNREENQKNSKETRQELNETLNSFALQFSANLKDNRTELNNSLKSFEEKFSLNIRDFNGLQLQKFNDLFTRQDQQKLDTERKLEKIRETLETKITSLQDENMKKLEEMRATVDEKLQATLEKRFNDSFTLISDRLEMVHKGLGEMQNLATSVGDIKKVMTNVKSRGILGEYQLANIIEDLLTSEQYEKNVKTKPNSGAIVEFAIKLPNNNSMEKTLWLPIDSKFPKADYEALVDAYDDGDAEKIDLLRKSFRNSIIKNAKDIKERYIDPPHTTEYGIMFLPFESLYAEVLRTAGLFEQIQKEYKITITGPTTLSALLNSLQMGFRTLAIEKRSSEVWDLLSLIKTEFNKFGTILDKTKKKLQEATNTIDQAGQRSRVISQKLKSVQELPYTGNKKLIDAESDQIIDLEENFEDLALNEGNAE